MVCPSPGRPFRSIRAHLNRTRCSPIRTGTTRWTSVSGWWSPWPMSASSHCCCADSTRRRPGNEVRPGSNLIELLSGGARRPPGTPFSCSYRRVCRGAVLPGAERLAALDRADTREVTQAVLDVTLAVVRPVGDPRDEVVDPGGGIQVRGADLTELVQNLVAQSLPVLAELLLDLSTLLLLLLLAHVSIPFLLAFRRFGGAEETLSQESPQGRAGRRMNRYCPGPPHCFGEPRWNTYAPIPAIIGRRSSTDGRCLERPVGADATASVPP
ncbi:hypothetical protein FAGKG844_350008 [Frankia sp. AgKG'84/4]